MVEDLPTLPDVVGARDVAGDGVAMGPVETWSVSNQWEGATGLLGAAVAGGAMPPTVTNSDPEELGLVSCS